MSGSPSNPSGSDEGVSKSGVSLTTDEHLNRIFKTLSRAYDHLGLESLTALREQIAALERSRDSWHASVMELEEQIAARTAQHDKLKQQTAEEHAAWKARVAALEAKLGSPSIPAPSVENAANRESAIERALRDLVAAIGICTCAPFWRTYRKVDPTCVYHDCETEIKAALAVLSLPTPEPPKQEPEAPKGLPEGGE